MGKVINVGAIFENDTYFSASIKDAGVSVVGHLTEEHFEEFVRVNFFDINEVIEKLKKGVKRYGRGDDDSV